MTPRASTVDSAQGVQLSAETVQSLSGWGQAEAAI